MGKSWGKIVSVTSGDSRLAYQGLNVLETANLTLRKTARCVICRAFKLTSSAFFERRSEILVSKGRLEHWNYVIQE